MTNSLTLDHLKTLTATAIDLAHTLYPALILDRDLPVLSFKSSRALGRCRAGASVAGARCQVVSISYNLPAVALLSESEVVELVAHEVAHAVEVSLYGKSNHGWRWQSICSALGGDAKRVYECDTEARAALKAAMAPAKRVRYFEWKCEKGAEWLKSSAHARRLRLVELAANLKEPTASMLRYGYPTGQTVLSNCPPRAPYWAARAA